MSAGAEPKVESYRILASTYIPILNVELNKIDSNRLLVPEYENSIEQGWREKKKINPKIFPGLLWGFSGVDIRGYKATVNLFETNYKDHAGLQSKFKVPMVCRANPYSINLFAIDKDDILMFATGNPSEVFGPEYKPFDTDRFIARLPSPPYSFMDRVISSEPQPWILKPDGWIEAEYDIYPDAWFFTANRSP